MKIDFSIENENKQNLISFVTTLGSYYTISLYFLFSIVDYIFYPQFYFNFILVRMGVVLSVLLATRMLRAQSDKSYTFVQIVSSVPFVFCSLSIYYMLFKINNPGTTYWAGLAIVIAGLSIGFAFSWPFYLFNIILTVLPLTALQLFHYTNTNEVDNFLNVIFLSSITVVCVTGRWFYMKLTTSDFQTRKQLAIEIESRNKIIEEKTKESVRLNALSKQFSPQIIEGIRTGNISLNSKIHKSEICAIFIDIKDSTVKVSTLERENLQKIINMYIEDVMSVFLKYDITIDKFLGDGVMGFSNNPQAQSDYVERVISAAIEIKNRISTKQEVYNSLWKSPFEVRIGISSGPASVGFYGSDLHVKSYTAIGRVVNLASRINGVAPANSIAVTNDVLDKAKTNNVNFIHGLNIQTLKKTELKGFEKDEIEVFVVSSAINQSVFEDENCPHGHGPLVISQLNNGIYALKCRYCDYVHEENSAASKKLAA